MNELVKQRCFNHGIREAVARCPECRRYFCRECITEHDDRVVCTTCLAALTAPKEARRPIFGWLWTGVQAVIALLLLWLTFFLIANLLLAIPDSFHENGIWQSL